MINKGFDAEITLDETPNDTMTEEKPLKYDNLKSKKVDINVLKARAKLIQDKENRKNIFIFSFFLVLLGIIGIYFTI
jgi:hypothetical protein